ncbi:hypothetical protein [Mesorhizobium sp. WSM2239]|uniref:Uncharacterized protein n=2 Tax=unclassified Mesorhizobium TaxID=325217 RepID=A0AAU8D6V7_9HYPH
MQPVDVYSYRGGESGSCLTGGSQPSNGPLDRSHAMRSFYNSRMEVVRLENPRFWLTFQADLPRTRPFQALFPNDGTAILRCFRIAPPQPQTQKGTVRRTALKNALHRQRKKQTDTDPIRVDSYF